MKKGLLSIGDSYKKYVNRWYNVFSQAGYIRVGIARKTPRLWALCRRECGKEEGGMITEHALPFVIPYLTHNEKILLSDDAIYFGTTFERIHAVILTGICLYGKMCKRSDIYSLPVVMSVDAKRLLPYINMPPFSEISVVDKQELIESLIINTSYLPNYIDSLVTQFQDLGKPYDVEFPIFYFKLQNQCDLKELILQFEKQIEIYLESMETSEKTFDLIGSYNITHPLPSINRNSDNYVILLDDVVADKEFRISSDFRKLRFFSNSDDECCVTSYSPHIIPEEIIVRDNPLFIGTKLEECWYKVYDAINFPQPIKYKSEFRDYIFRNDKKSLIELEDLWNAQVAEYIYHCRRSLVIWSNYLLSFHKFIETLDILKSILKVRDTMCRIELKHADMELIIGAKLAEEILPLLQDMLDDKYDETLLPIIEINPITNFDVIPAKLEDNYLYHCREDFKHCTTVSNLISSEFSNQHRWLEQKSRENLNVFYDRLRFGTSYTSLYQKFLFSSHNIGGIKKLKLRLHQGIDYRIDLGSVVPKYVCQQKKDYAWLRLFKSGENEDKLRDQLSHIILRGLNRLSELCCDNSIPQWMVNLFFNLTFGNLVLEDKFINFIGIKSDIIYDRGKYVTKIYDENRESKELMDLCESYNLIKFEEDDFCIIQDNEYTKYLNSYGVILDRETQDLFDKYVDAAYWICYKTDDETVREMQNWLYVSDISLLEEALSQWKTNFFNYLLSEISGMDDKIESLCNEFYYIYDQYPDGSILWLEITDEDSYYKIEKADKKAILPILPVLDKIANRIQENKRNIISDKHSQLNNRLDLYNAILNIFIDRFCMDDIDYEITKFDIDIIKGNNSDLELKKWLEVISKDKKEFEECDLSNFKEKISSLLSKF